MSLYDLVDISPKIPSHLTESAWIEHTPFAEWLIRKTQPKCLVELGTHTGLSYFAFCEAAKAIGMSRASFHAIDTWEGDKHAGHYNEDVFNSVAQINKTRYHQFSELHKTTFDEAVSLFPDNSIDVLHIDGLHTYNAVEHDYAIWRPKLSDCGVILFHDTQVRVLDFGVWKLWGEIAGVTPHFEFNHGNGLGVAAIGNDVPAIIKELCSSNPVDQQVIRAAYEIAGLRVSEYQAAHSAMGAERSKRIAMESSISWRITAPLRRARRWARTLTSWPPKKRRSH